MKSSLLFIALIAVISFPSIAQQDSSDSKASYFFALHSGALLGKKGHGSSLSAALVQGIRYKAIALGAGVGYDAYREWRTLPVFASVAYDFGRLRGSSDNNALFLQFNAGYAKAWRPAVESDQFVYEADGGLYLHPLLGYRVDSGKMQVYFTAGYKVQRIGYEEIPRWWWNWGPSKVTTERIVERLSVQIGFGWR